jgi:DNA-binding beta-propeller fold protein YncE
VQPPHQGGGSATDATRVRGAAVLAAALGLLLALFSFLFLPPARSAAAPAAPAPSGGGRAVEQGITIDAAVTPAGDSGGGGLQEGAEVRFQFHLADAGGTPLAGAFPAAWLDRVENKPGAPPAACEERVKQLVDGNLFSQATLDLNVYYVIALNDDASLSVVDPLFGYGGTKLLAMVPLASPGEDWALDDPIRRLFVAMPAAGAVAVVDTDTFKPLANLPTGPRPTRTVLQPDGGYLWVTSEGNAAGGAALDAFDPRTQKRVAHFPLGTGPHDLAASDDSRFVFVTTRDDATVAVVDVHRLALAATVKTGGRPVSIAWSRQAQLAYASDAAGAIVAIAPPDPAHPAEAPIRARIAAESGLAAIAFPADGRYGFVVNPTTDRVHILDTAGNTIVQTAHVEGGPDQIDFSADLAYVRHQKSETVLTIPLKSIGQPGAPVTVMDVPGGQHPLGEGTVPAHAASIVRAPGANAVLIANPADAAVYYYQEGMAAPMGSFHDFERQPRAVLVLDRTLKEAAPGTYTTTAKLPAGGPYRLAFFLDSPRLLHCFDLTVTSDPELAARRLAALPAQVAYLVETRTTPADRPYPLRFRLTNPGTGAPLTGQTDVQVLFFRPPGTDRHTLTAHEQSPGIYTADLPLTPPGSYSIFIQSDALHLPFHRSPRLLVESTPPAAAPR